MSIPRLGHGFADQRTAWTAAVGQVHYSARFGELADTIAKWINRRGR